jgi:hypothetical protein
MTAGPDGTHRVHVPNGGQSMPWPIRVTHEDEPVEERLLRLERLAAEHDSAIRHLRGVVAGSGRVRSTERQD